MYSIAYNVLADAVNPCKLLHFIVVSSWFVKYFYLIAIIFYLITFVVNCCLTDMLIYGTCNATAIITVIYYQYYLLQDYFVTDNANSFPDNVTVSNTITRTLPILSVYDG